MGFAGHTADSQSQAIEDSWANPTLFSKRVISNDVKASVPNKAFNSDLKGPLIGSYSNTLCGGVERPRCCDG